VSEEKEHSLNSDQRLAVETTDGPILIVAGPGSGKTRVVTRKILYLLKEKGVKPENILALTFSDKAAEEMRGRVEKGLESISELQISTFHSFCKDLLNDNVLDAGINGSARVISKEHMLVWALENFDSFGTDYLKVPFNPSDLVNTLMEGISTFNDELIEPKQLQEFIAKKLKEKLGGGEEDYFRKLNDLAKVFKAYQEYKEKNDLIDFDDMICRAYRLLKENPLVLKKYQQRFKYILVDEFQDTNYAQLALVELLARAHKNLSVVADDDQCIYRFRGAYLTNIHQLKEFFPKTKEIPLRRNYRSTQQIVDLSQQLIGRHGGRLEKKLFSEKTGPKPKVIKTDLDSTEAEFVADKIQEMSKEKKNFKDFYVLTRKRKDGAKFADALKKRNIPVEFVGSTNFFNLPIITEMLAYLQVLSNPLQSGVSWAKVLKRENVSEIDVQKIFLKAKELTPWGDPIDHVYEVMLEHLDGLNLNEKELVKVIAKRMENLMKFKDNHSCAELVAELMLNQTDLYKKQVFCLDFEAKQNIRILNKFFGIVKDFEIISGSDLRKLLKHLGHAASFEIELSEQDSDENTVKVTTIHQSKGKQAKTVFLCDVAQRHLPLNFKNKPFYVPTELCNGVQSDLSPKALHIEEERRLMYVAMTRAEENLFIVFPKKYAENKKPVNPSDFIKKDLNYESNEGLELEEVSSNEVSTLVKTEKDIDKLILQAQKQANQSITQLDLKPAMQRLMELAKLKHLRDKNSLDGFSEQQFDNLSFPQDHKILEKIECKPVSLVNKDSIHFSPSALGKFEDCPMQYKFAYILGIPTAPKPFFDLGTSVHNTIEALTKMKREGKKIDEETGLKVLDCGWITGNYSSEAAETQAKENAKKMISNFLTWEETFDGEIAAVEEWFPFKINGFEVRCKLDRLNKTSGGEFEVVDYKSSKTALSSNKLRENLQMNVYALAVKKHFSQAPTKIIHYYPKPKTHENGKVVEARITSEMLEETENKIKEIIDTITKEKFEVKEKPNCMFCDYKGICGWFKENGS